MNEYIDILTNYEWCIGLSIDFEHVLFTEISRWTEKRFPIQRIYFTLLPLAVTCSKLVSCYTK